MTGKKANSDEAIINHPDSRWRAQIVLGCDANGKRIHKKAYGRTRREIREKLEHLKAD